MSDVGKLSAVRTTERLVDVGGETKGEPSSCITPTRTGMSSLGALGVRSREDAVRNVPSTTGVLVHVSWIVQNSQDIMIPCVGEARH
jgi:hypothetical protein